MCTNSKLKQKKHKYQFRVSKREDLLLWLKCINKYTLNLQEETINAVMQEELEEHNDSSNGHKQTSASSKRKKK